VEKVFVKLSFFLNGVISHIHLIEIIILFHQKNQGFGCSCLVEYFPVQTLGFDPQHHKKKKKGKEKEK
jgi:hypothetical protein